MKHALLLRLQERVLPLIIFPQYAEEKLILLYVHELKKRVLLYQSKGIFRVLLTMEHTLGTTFGINFLRTLL